MYKKLTLLLVALVILLSCATYAAVPKTISYQGKLLDLNTKKAITSTKEVTFVLYNDPTGGSPLWTETKIVTPDTKGIFNTILGEITPINLAVIEPLWLAVQYPTGAPNEQWPRKQLAMLPYTMFAVTAESASYANYAANAGHAVTADSAVSYPGSGALVPIGMVLTYAGATTPEGYLFCDGTTYNLTARPDLIPLYNVIGNTYGGIIGTSLRVPDYRGYFIRGWDDGASNDPDHATRNPRGDSASGNRVGTQQFDQYKPHKHPFWTMSGAYSDALEGIPVRGRSSYWTQPNPVSVISYGGNETRPKNIYVMYIIRAK